MKRSKRTPTGVPRVDHSKQITAVRKRHGWTQGELAAYLGCDQSEVSRWERGAGCAVPHVGRLLVLALRLPTVLATGSLAIPAPADSWDAVKRLLGGQAWRVLGEEGPRSSRTLGRLAVVLGLCALCDPEALEKVCAYS